MMPRSRNRVESFPDTYYKMFPRKKIKTVTFIVTHQCNLRCSYCYEHNKNDGRMSVETARACVDALFRADAEHSHYLNEDTAHGIILDFIGGEPLLEIGLIDQTVDYFREQAMERGHRWMLQYMVSMSSNGMSYDTPSVKRFLAKNKGRVSMAITLDGDKETHDSCRVDCNGCGSYDRAVAAFLDAKERFGHDGTKFTIAPANVDRTFGACKDMIERFGLHTLHCNCVYEEGWTDELAGVLYGQLKALADWAIETRRYEDLALSIFDPLIGQPKPDEDKQNWCGGTGKMLAFDVDGTIYPCLRYAPLSIGNRPPLRIGDVEHGIGILPDDAATVEMLESITRQSQSSAECLSCPIASGCGWCSAYNYETYGTPNKRAVFICPTHKARVMAASYYHNRIYQLKGEAERFPFNIPRAWAEPIVGGDEYDMLVKLAEKE